MMYTCAAEFDFIELEVMLVLFYNQIRAQMIFNSEFINLITSVFADKSACEKVTMDLLQNTPTFYCQTKQEFNYTVCTAMKNIKNVCFYAQEGGV